MRRLVVAAALVSLAAGCNSTVTAQCTKDTQCDDGIFCNGAETCDTSTHACKAGTPPSCDDSVACTVDICDDGAGKCAHVATAGMCTAGQTCDATGGCVPACDSTSCNTSCTGSGFASGACVGTSFCQCAPATTGTVQGTALLFGHSDNSGISVALAGTTMTATTGTDGSFTIMNVPAGVYTATFSAAKYAPGTATAIAVGTATNTVVPTVTLTHGISFGPLSVSQSALDFNTEIDARFTADRKHGIVSMGAYTGPSESFAMSTDGSGTAAPILSGPVGSPLPIVSFQVSNDHVVYPFTGGIWTRPLNASAAPSLLVGQPPSNGTVTILGTVGALTLVQVTDPSKAAGAQNQWVAVASDGSAAPITVWQQANATASVPTLFYNNDTNVVFATLDSSLATQVSMHTFNLSTKADQAAPLTGFLASSGITVLGVGPAQVWVIGQGAITGPSSRTFVYKSGAATATVSAGVSAATNGANSAIAVADPTVSLGFTYLDATGYEFFGTTVSTTSTPYDLIPVASVLPGNQAPQLVGRAVVYADASGIRVEGVPTTNNTNPFSSGALDASSTGNQFKMFTSVITNANGVATGGNVVWADGTVGTSLQFKGMTLSYPLPAAPTVVALGGAQTVPCSAAYNALMNGGFFYQCSDSSTLNVFLPPFAAAAVATAVDTGVVQGSVAALGTSRVVYRKTDGSYWTSDGTNKAVLSKTADSNASFQAVNNQWVVFFDGTMSRVSQLGGTTIDEPLSPCDVIPAGVTGFAALATPDWFPSVAGQQMVALGTQCAGTSTNPLTVSFTNLP